MKLQGKMFLHHTITVVMLLFAMYIIVNYSLSKGMYEREVQTLEQYFSLHRIETLKLIDEQTISAEQVFTSQYAPFIASHLSSNSNFQVQLFDKNEVIVGTSDTELMLKRGDITAALSGSTATIIAQENGNRYFIYSTPFMYKDKIVGGVRYILDLSQHVATINEMRIWFISVALVCLIIAVFTGFSFTTAILKPLYALQRALRQVTRGDYTIKVKQYSKDEIGEISNDFNVMSDSLMHHVAMLEYEKDKQKRFFDNMTHELKTPLTSIIGFSNLINKVSTVDEVQHCNQYIHKESTKLLHMVEQLLQTSLMQQDTWSIQCQYVNLNDFTKECMQILMPTLEKSSIKFTFIGEPSIVYIDPARTQQVIFNIIDNAIKHSECSTILVDIRDEKDKATISIKDNGKGIAKEQLSSLFKSGIKPNQTISPQSYGLGMPIVKQLMELQGGSVSVESESQIGTKVTLTFIKNQ